MRFNQIAWCLLHISILNKVSTLDPRLSSSYRPGFTITPPMIQGSDHLKNIYIRTDLIEDPSQKGIRLELVFTLSDSISCAPIENALVEIWGPDAHGSYPKNGDDRNSCSTSSALRGATETNAHGVAVFNTIFPGATAGRPPHLHAVIRTDWFEHSNNHTLDSDASWEVASIGQIFFPDQINAQVRKQSDYLPLSGPPVVNSDDPIFRAQSEAWLARTDYNVSHPAKSLRAQVDLFIDTNRTDSLALAPAPYLCQSSTQDLDQGDGPLSDSSARHSASSVSSKLQYVSLMRILFGLPIAYVVHVLF